MSYREECDLKTEPRAQSTESLAFKARLTQRERRAQHCEEEQQQETANEDAVPLDSGVPLFQPLVDGDHHEKKYQTNDCLGHEISLQLLRVDFLEEGTNVAVNRCVGDDGVIGDFSTTVYPEARIFSRNSLDFLASTGSCSTDV